MSQFMILQRLATHQPLPMLLIMLLPTMLNLKKNKHVSGKMSLQVSVLGPFANSPEMLLGNYYGTPAGPVTTPFEAIKV